MLSRLFHLVGIGRAGFFLAREGAFDPLDEQLLPTGPRFILRMIHAVAKPEKRRDLPGAVQRLGPSHIKLGQFLATRPDVVGKAMSAELSTLQDRLPPFSESEAQAELSEQFGAEADALFPKLGPAIAAASIAQVHKVEIDGAPRAVKILRPDIERVAARDFAMFYTGAGLAESVSREMRRLRMVDVIGEHERVAKIEMDLRMEAAAIGEMAENVKDDPGFRVPEVDWTRTSKRVLTTEWIDGVKLTNFEALEKAGHDRLALSRIVMQSFLRHALRDGFFHADMHPGNLFVDGEGTVVAVDFGIVGRLNPEQRRFLAEILWGYIKQDYRRAAEVHFEAGYVPPRHSIDDFAQALRAIGTPILNASAKDISMARLLAQLFEVTEMFDMQTRPELIMLQRTMVVVEGLARELDPDFNMWKVSEPVVGEWISRNLGPVGQIERAAEGASALARLTRRLPQLVDEAEKLANRADLAVAGAQGQSMATEPVQKKASLWSALPLWVGAGALAILAINAVL